MQRQERRMENKPRMSPAPGAVSGGNVSSPRPAAAAREDPKDMPLRDLQPVPTCQGRPGPAEQPHTNFPLPQPLLSSQIRASRQSAGSSALALRPRTVSPPPPAPPRGRKPPPLLRVSCGAAWQQGCNGRAGVAFYNFVSMNFCSGRLFTQTKVPAFAQLPPRPGVPGPDCCVCVCVCVCVWRTR